MKNLTPHEIKDQLRDPQFLKYCVSLLMSQQLEIEREWNLSTFKNGKGVSCADAKYFDFIHRNPLYPELMSKAILKVGRYAKQLATLLEMHTIEIQTQVNVPGSLSAATRI